MTVFPSVIGYRDGSAYPVNAEELNKPINQLKTRTDYLKSRVDLINDQGLFSSVASSEVVFHDAESLIVGSPVYLRPEDGKYAPAQALVLAEPAYAYTYAYMSAFVVGMVSEISGERGRITVYGKLDLTGVSLLNLVETGETFRNGPYYLSPASPGRITKAPKGPAVYLGIVMQDPQNPGMGLEAHVMPQMKDLFESHLHKSFKLSDGAAGTVVRTGSTEHDYEYSVSGFKPDDYLPGNPSELLTPSYLLNIRGTYSGAGSPTYTFWLSNPSTTTTTAILHWTTDDGSDDNTLGVAISSFEAQIDLGNGLYAILEKGDPDYTLADFDTLVVDLPQDQTNPKSTWTISDFAEATRGWVQRRVREEVLGHVDNLPASDCPARVVGDYTNPDGRTTEFLLFVAMNNGDLAIGDVDLAVYDSSGTLIDNLTNIGYGPGTQLSNGLWLFFTSGSTTAVTIGEIWLTTFADEAPGAEFEYTTDIDRHLAAYYPPSPQLDMVLETNGVTQSIRGEFREGEGTYFSDHRTLYWFGDTHAVTPFPVDYVSVSNRGSERYAKNHKLYSTVLRAADTGLVTSLTAADGAQVAIVDAKTGLPANTGDLELRLSFGVSIQNSNKEGYQVVKGIDELGNLISGPVVEQLVAGTNIELQQLDDAPTGQGRMRISASSQGFTRAMFNNVTLHNAKQELVPQSNIPFIKLRGWNPNISNNTPTGFTLKFRVPYTLTGKYKLALYFTMFGVSEVLAAASPDGRQYAGLKLSYTVAQDYTNTGNPDTPVLVTRNLRDIGPTGVLYNQVELANDVPLGVQAAGYKAYDPFLFHNEPTLLPVDGQVVGPFGQTIPQSGDDPLYVTSGDIVTVRLDRQSPVAHLGSSAYQGELGFVANEWKLLEV